MVCRPTPPLIPTTSLGIHEQINVANKINLNRIQQFKLFDVQPMQLFAMYGHLEQICKANLSAERQGT